MIVRRLDVKDYRNAAARTVEFSDGRNAFVGPNARGKTNLLEAVYFAGVGKSFRTPRDKELIKADAARAFITVVAEKESGTETVKIAIDRNTNKRVAVNDVPISRMSELMGVCPVVLFCPDGLKIIKEAPADRRRFMDISLCQVSKAYFASLSRYDKILTSRNRLLKSGGANDNTLAPWDELLAAEGARIVKSRRGYIKKLQEPASECHAFLSGGAETPELEYEGAEGETVDEIKDELIKALKRDRESDMRLKYTHTGPHKDDIKIKVNGIDIRTYGSQGQQRTVALALKLAEMRLLSDVLGTSPVLLLDDVFSELDASRRKKLLSALDGFQTIITSTDSDEFKEFGVNVIEM
ncbi:MAG: DNA replication/repair protein RecF [Clostridiales bacterium]|nr:DNA replication/repair protein RecF [Clostridiales bacterium]